MSSHQNDDVLPKQVITKQFIAGEQQRLLGELAQDQQQDSGNKRGCCGRWTHQKTFVGKQPLSHAVYTYLVLCIINLAVEVATALIRKEHDILKQRCGYVIFISIIWTAIALIAYFERSCLVLCWIVLYSIGTFLYFTFAVLSFINPVKNDVDKFAIYFFIQGAVNISFLGYFLSFYNSIKKKEKKTAKSERGDSNV